LQEGLPSISSFSLSFPLTFRRSCLRRLPLFNARCVGFRRFVVRKFCVWSRQSVPN